LATLSGSERGRYVQGMFTQIARRYDLMNRLMTFGQDMRWRREVIRRASLPPTGNLLDLGAGTGDLAREALRQYPDCQPTAADFTLEMMKVGRQLEAQQQPDSPALAWSAADALNLPFPEGVFDAVVSAFLLRNVGSLNTAIQEQYRVLKPGGRLVCLDTTPPAPGLLAPLIKFHLHVVIPTLGGLISGDSQAYQYLPSSTEAFLQPEQLADTLRQNGFRQVGFIRRMFGTVAIHWGVK
jgi:demethylmenaquinone methyltransferase/2-methoxy-6-polyprenyl-1,4-benzoquinol methylase